MILKVLSLLATLTNILLHVLKQGKKDERDAEIKKINDTIEQKEQELRKVQDERLILNNKEVVVEELSPQEAADYWNKKL